MTKPPVVADADTALAETARRRRPDGSRPPLLQVGRAVQHHAGHAAGHHQRVDRADLAARHLPRHRPEPAGARQRQLSAVDADGLPGGDRGAGRPVRPARRHVRPGPHLQPRFRRLHGRRHRAVVRPVPSRRRRAVADRLARDPGHRRRDADGLFGGDPDRRVPRQPARHGARGQHGRRRRRVVPGSADRRLALRVALAGHLLGRRADRHPRHHLELPVAARSSASGRPADSTGPAPCPSASA